MQRTLLLSSVFAIGCAASPPHPGSTAHRLPPTAWRPATGPSLEALLNVHRASSASASPDGTRIAFLSDAPGTPQAYLLTPGAAPVEEPQWQRVTHEEDRISFVRFTPDGRTLFLGRDHGGDENTQILRANADGTGLVDLTQSPRVRHMFGAIRHDGQMIAYASNARSPGDFDVYVRPVGDGEPRRVFEGHGHFEAYDFSPDGTQLAVVEERGSFDTDVHLVDVATGAHRLLTAHHGDERWMEPHFTHDGHALFVLSDRGREFMNVALLPIAAGEPTFVVTVPHDVDEMAVSPSGDRLALAVNVDGAHDLLLYDAHAPSGPIAMAHTDLPAMVITSLAFAADGASLVLTGSRASVPDELYRVEVATGHSARVTHSDHAGVDETSLVEPTVEHVRARDGIDVPVLWYVPRVRAPGVRVPVVVNVHGGPEGQATPLFSAVTQYLLGHGYAVATPNVRGSTGYGKHYAHLDDVEHREDSVRDLDDVNRWMRARADVDPDRLVVMGGSYGGYMTLAAITLYPDTWAAACEIVGIANFRTFLERTAAYRRALREAEYGSLAHDSALLDRISPLRRVDAITAPLFIIHGTNDPRVPIHEAEQMAAALRARGRRVEFMRFDNEGHGLIRRENRLSGYGGMVRFFDAVLAP